MERKKVAVLFGGCSKEYEVSLHSAYAVITSIDAVLYEVIMIGITRHGNWFHFQGSIEKIKEDTWHLDDSCVPMILSPSRDHGLVTFHKTGVQFTKVDAVFPVLHGRNGEDGTVQGLLALAGIPCVGCGTLSSALCMDKALSKQIVGLSGVKNVPFVVCSTLDVETESELHHFVEALRYPLFVKPVTEGSSFGISKVDKQEDLPAAVNMAFQYDDRIIIEEAVTGFEVGCSVIGNQRLTVGEVDEIELTSGFFDYEEKYTLKSSSIHMPARISREKALEIKEAAKTIYRALLCEGYARVDLFLTDQGEVLFNEVNTIPGFTDHSRFPNMLKGIGMVYPEISKSLISLALLKKQRNVFSEEICK